MGACVCCVLLWGAPLFVKAPCWPSCLVVWFWRGWCQPLLLMHVVVLFCK